MRASIVSGHLLGTVAATVAWEVVVQLPAHQPGPMVVAAGIVGPPIAAALSLALIAAVERATKPTPRQQAQYRRAVTAPTRRELTR